MQIYPGKLQKRINIYSYYFHPFRRGNGLGSIWIKINTQKKVDKYLAI